MAEVELGPVAYVTVLCCRCGQEQTAKLTDDPADMPSSCPKCGPLKFNRNRLPLPSELSGRGQRRARQASTVPVEPAVIRLTVRGYPRRPC
jgi:DNA-directed RNA polymerase subunit RPC12/RpoP